MPTANHGLTPGAGATDTAASSTQKASARIDGHWLLGTGREF
jgi:hypothetical protein